MKEVKIKEVLNDLNLTLERLIEFLRRNRINISQNLDSTINEFEYSILNKQFRNKIIPDSIKQIENNLGIILIQKQQESDVTTDLIIDNFYILNSKNEIVGLNIYNVVISDVSFLSKYKKITYLSLINCGLQNIKSFSTLIDLKILNLQTNDIGNYYPIKNLNSLKELNIADGTILNFNFLPEQLEILTLKDCNIIDLNFLKILKRPKYLDLSYNSITDISPLKKFESIRDLDLSYNKIVSIDGINKLNSFDFLYLNNNEIEDIYALKDVEIFTELHLGGNKIFDLTPLYPALKQGKINFINGVDNPLIYPPFGIVKLGEVFIVEWFDNIINRANEIINECKINKESKLDLGNLGLTDLALVKNIFELEDLEELILSNVWAKYNLDKQEWEPEFSKNKFYSNNIFNLPIEITKLKKLKKLIIGGDWKSVNKWNRWRIKDISFLNKLDNIEFINLSNNQIETFKVTKNLKNLKTIHLNNNHIKNISISRLLNLEYLFLSNNFIDDLSFFKKI